MPACGTHNLVGWLGHESGCLAYQLGADTPDLFAALGPAAVGLRLGCNSSLSREFRPRRSRVPPRPRSTSIRIRIGLHTGEAIKDADKFFGKRVVQAFRVADLAQGGEILVSSLTKELVESAGDLSFDEGREVELKGLEGTHRVFGVGRE